MKKLAPVLCLLLSGCLAENEFYPVPFPANGPAPGPAPAPVQPVNPRVVPQATPIAPILDDPENPETQPYDYDEPIIAASEIEARMECQRRAARDGVSLKRVQLPRVYRPGTNQRYYCLFQANSRE